MKTASFADCFTKYKDDCARNTSVDKNSCYDNNVCKYTESCSKWIEKDGDLRSGCIPTKYCDEVADYYTSLS